MRSSVSKRAAGGQEASKSAKKSRKSGTHNLVGAGITISESKKNPEKVRRLVATYFFRSLLGSVRQGRRCSQ